MNPAGATATNDLPEGYRLTELGPLPEEWRVVRLGEVFTVVSRAKRKVRIHEDKRYSLLSVRLYGKGVTFKQEVLGKELKTQSWFEVLPGDFVLLKIWARKGAYGFVPPGLRNAIVSGDYPILSLNRSIAFQEFVEFALSRAEQWSALESGAKGATNRQRVHERDFLNIITIPLPPLAEQRAIAHVLRTVQQAREAAERVIAALRDLKKSLMRHLFTYGPVAVGDVGAKNFSPLRDTEIGPLPEHWQVVRLGEVFDIQQGKSLSPKSRAGLRKRPFLRTANVLWGRIELSSVDEMHFEEAEEERLALKPGDLLVCEGGDIGRTAIWEGQLPLCLYQNHLHRLRASKPDSCPAFYMYWMQAAWLLLNLYGGEGNKTTIPNLSQSRLSSFPIPLPPLPEQQEIARILQSVDRRIQAEEAKARALSDLFQTLLHDLMTARRRLPIDFIAPCEAAP